MEVLKDISQLTKGCGVTFIKNDNFHFYEYLMVHPNREVTPFVGVWNETENRFYFLSPLEKVIFTKTCH